MQNSFEILMDFKQNGSVEEYTEQFELYAIPVKDANPEAFKGIFLNGLKEVRAELRLHWLNSLLEMMDLVQRTDERNRALQLALGTSFN